MIPVGIYFTQNGLEFGITGTSLGQSKVIATKGAKAGLEVLILQFPIPVFIEMPLGVGGNSQSSRVMSRCVLEQSTYLKLAVKSLRRSSDTPTVFLLDWRESFSITWHDIIFSTLPL